MGNEFQKIKLIRATLPALRVGRYKVHARQSLSSPVKKDLPALESTFVVSCRSYSLAAGDVFSQYPPAEAAGNFGNTLPHLILSRATLPWMRGGLTKQKETKPWLALICLSEGDDFILRNQTIGELTRAGSEKDVYHPAYTFHPGTGEQLTDVCEVVDLATGSLEAVMLRERELEYLCHVRAVDLYHTADEIIPRDGRFAAVVCNRFPVTPPETSRKNTVMLLSMEGYQDHLPEGTCFSEVLRYSYARFVVLHRWSFTSQGQLEPGFRKLMREIKTAPLALPKPETKDDAAKLIARGYVPLRHHTRTGERTVSLYRGPLTPYRVEQEEQRECTTADGEIRYDPVLGFFDMTYASAWQLGRLMMMENADLAKLLSQWRKSVVSKVFLHRQTCKVRAMMPGVKTPNGYSGSMREQALELICSAAEGETVPTTDPTGLRQEATRWLENREAVLRAQADRRDTDATNSSL